MAIIKQDQIEFKASGAHAPAVEDLDLRLHAMVDAAEAAARDLIEAAKVEADQLRSEARQAGHAQGVEEGRAEGRAAALEETSERSAAVCASWSAVLEQWERDRESQLRSAENDLVATAMLLAEAIVRRSVDLDPTSVRDALQSALELVRRPSDVLVRINPADEQFVSTILDELVSGIASCRSVRLECDGSVEAGGCRLELEGGEIDATISTQLERIAQVLLPHAHEVME
ncbi:MAG: hypothetical protein MK095_01725 [Phycisphaerales bacterium]|nr:hypothetical protein [Phycisphaerales bacterium]